jgi:hypothetical protein
MTLALLLLGWLFLFRLRRKKIPKIIAPRTATPPTTPPAMAPTDVFFPGGLGLGLGPGKMGLGPGVVTGVETGLEGPEAGVMAGRVVDGICAPSWGVVIKIRPPLSVLASHQ